MEGRPSLIIQLKGRSASMYFPESLISLYAEAAKKFDECLATSQYRFYFKEKPLLTEDDLMALRENPKIILSIRHLPKEPKPAALIIAPKQNLALWYNKSEIQSTPTPHYSLVCAPLVLPSGNPRVLGGELHYEIHPESLEFTEHPPMQVPRYNFAWAASEDKVYVIGGVSRKGYTTDCEVFNLKQRSWLFIDSHPGPARSGMAATMWGHSSIYCFGGFDGMEYSNMVMHYKAVEHYWVNCPLVLPVNSYYLGVADVGKGLLITGGVESHATFLLSLRDGVFKEKQPLPEDVECTRIIMKPTLHSGQLLFVMQDYAILSYNVHLNQWNREGTVGQEV